MQPGSRMIFKRSNEEVIQWRHSLVFCRHHRAHKAKQRTHTHTRKWHRREVHPRWQTCGCVNGEVSAVALFSDSLLFFLWFFIIYTSSPSISVTPPLYCIFLFFCISIILHICFGDILIKINLSGCFPSQTVTTAQDPNRKKSKSVWKLCYSVCQILIYLFIYSLFWKHFRQNTFRRKFDVRTLDEAEKRSCIQVHQQKKTQQQQQ